MVKKEKPPLSSLWAAKFFDFSWSGSVFFQGRDQAIMSWFLRVLWFLWIWTFWFCSQDLWTSWFFNWTWTLVLFLGSFGLLWFFSLDIGTLLVFQFRYWITLLMTQRCTPPAGFKNPFRSMEAFFRSMERSQWSACIQRTSTNESYFNCMILPHFIA